MFEIHVVADTHTGTAKRYVLPSLEGKPEEIWVEPNVLLDLSVVRFIGRGFGLDNSARSIGLVLSKEGAKKFAEIGEKYQNKRVAVFLNGQLQSAPKAQELRGIRGDDTVVISGDFTDQFVAKLNAAVSSGPLPAELTPVQDFSQYKTGDALWQLLEQQLEFEKHFHPGETWTTGEVKAAGDRRYAIAAELLKRFPDDPNRWEAKKIKSQTRDTQERNEESEKLVRELATAPDAPADIRQWARLYLIDSFLVGQGTSADKEITDYCRDYPEDRYNCQRLKLRSAGWMVTFRRDPDRAREILKDLAEHGDTYTSQEAKDLLRKQQELLAPAGRAKYEREWVAGLEQMSGLAPLIGKPLILKTTAIDGTKINAENFRGKVVLLEFWATWCGPCVQEIPNLSTLYKKYHERGFEIIGVSYDSNAEAVQKFVRDKGIPWPECVHKDGLLGSFDPPGIPAAVLVSRKGNVVGLCRYPYTDSDAEVQKRREADIEKLLKE